MHEQKIVVIGSTNTDMVIKTRSFPLPGETLLGGEFFMNPGGKGANQAVAAVRLGGHVTFVAKIGNDLFGRQALEQFEKEGINTDYIMSDLDNASGVALITVDGSGENTIVVAPGANGNLTIEDIKNSKDEIEKAQVILIQLEIPMETVVYAIKISSEMGKKVILNPAPAQQFSDAVFKHIFIFTPNETEAETYSGIKVNDKTTAEKAAEVLKSKGIKNIVITLGAKGAYVSTDEVSELFPAPKVEAKDTTAAGDVFSGALAVAIAKGNTIVEAVKFSLLAASLAVTKMGAQSSAPFYKDLLEFKKQLK